MTPSIEKIIELLIMVQEEDYQSIGTPEEEQYLVKEHYISFFTNSVVRPNKYLLTAKGLQLIDKYKEIKKETWLDSTWLPDHYVEVQPINYKGSGEHSVYELEALLKQSKEYQHNQQIIKQNMIQEIINLKLTNLIEC